MDRRALIQKFFFVSTLIGIFLLGGCGKQEKVERSGSGEKLWDLTSGKEKLEEAIEISYAIKTPVLFRDASMGKADSSFVPRVSGG
jgi:hypothetical protein